MAKVVIHLGHSNCKGRAAMASLPAEYQTVFTNIKVWNGSALESLNYATNNNQFPSTEKTNEFGIEFSLLKTLQESWNETIYYLKYGVGGSKIAADAGAVTWGTSESGELNDRATSELNELIAYMWNVLSIRTGYEFYFIQHVGENDAGVEAESLAFEANCIALIQSRLDRLSCTAFNNCIKLIGIVQNSINQSSTYRQNILDSYPGIVAEFSDDYEAYSHDMTSYPLQGDLAHYTAAGYEDCGNDIAEYIINNNI